MPPGHFPNSLSRLAGALVRGNALLMAGRLSVLFALHWEPPNKNADDLARNTESTVALAPCQSSTVHS